MKVFIVLAAFVASALASDLGYGGGHIAAAPIVSKVVNVNTGHSTQSRKQDAGGNYAFAYDAAWQDGAWGSGAHGQRESGDAWGNKEGSYSLNIGDGRSRLVKYVADGAGFRASIKTNEPGIVASAPAATSINTPHGYDAAPLPVATHVGGYSDGGANLAYGASNLALGGLAYGGNGLGAGLGLAGNAGYGNAGLAYGNAGYGNAGLAYGNAGLGLAGNGLGAGLGHGIGGGYAY